MTTNDGDAPSAAMRVNVVQPLEDSDFRYVRNICDKHVGWELVYERKRTRVWTKVPPADDGTKFKMIKVRSEFPDVSAEVAYDVLHDAEFRKKWDKYMQSTIPIGYLNPNNDICYYSLGALPPFRSRDFVMQRSWLDTGNEKYICGHSVWHDSFPPNKTHVRGIIHLTVYFVRRKGTGCELIYVTHSDPKGKLSSWLVNRLTTIIAPRLVKKMHKACLQYSAWKCQHNPNEKPWLYPDIQTNYPRIRLEECRPRDVPEQDDLLVDESNATENAVCKWSSSDDDGGGGKND